jgi:hypothetical protein
MYSMPLGVILKPHSSKLCLINDLSAGTSSCNSMIPPQECFIKLDSMCMFGNALQWYKAYNLNISVILVKSNMSQAYWLILMHPRWQIKQIVTINSECHIDCCNSFGSGASCYLFWIFMSLVLWIAHHIKFLADLLCILLWTCRFHPVLPALWPVLACKAGAATPPLGWTQNPTWSCKLVFGSTLHIISFKVDSEAMSVSMDEQDTQNLITVVQTFCNTEVWMWWSLHEFQQLAGWINSTLYHDMSRACNIVLWFMCCFAATCSISLFASITWTSRHIIPTGHLFLVRFLWFTPLSYNWPITPMTYPSLILPTYSLPICSLFYSWM